MGSLHEGGTVGAMLITAIRRYPDRPAIADNRTRWTYSELGDAAARMMSVFRTLGLRKGDGVALLATNRVETWAVVTAAAIMGLRYTPLHPLAAEDDHAFIVDNAEALALIVEGERFAERGRAILGRAPGMRHLLSFGPIEGGRDLLAEMRSAEPAPLIDEAEAEMVCWLAYTGGTTGRSKGVMIAHRCVLNMSAIIFSDWEWPKDIRYLASTPITHAGGVNIFPIMMRGGFTRVLPGFDIEAFCRTVEAEKINTVLLVPTMIYALIDAKDIRAKYGLSSLEMIIYGALRFRTCWSPPTTSQGASPTLRALRWPHAGLDYRRHKPSSSKTPPTAYRLHVRRASDTRLGSVSVGWPATRMCLSRTCGN